MTFRFLFHVVFDVSQIVVEFKSENFRIAPGSSKVKLPHTTTNLPPVIPQATNVITCILSLICFSFLTFIPAYNFRLPSLQLFIVTAAYFSFFSPPTLAYPFQKIISLKHLISFLSTLFSFFIPLRYQEIIRLRKSSSRISIYLYRNLKIDRSVIGIKFCFLSFGNTIILKKTKADKKLSCINVYRYIINLAEIIIYFLSSRRIIKCASCFEGARHNPSKIKTTYISSLKPQNKTILQTRKK